MVESTTETEGIRRFEEPPPVNYGDVPAVLKWVVGAMLHLDRCFDSRLSAIEQRINDEGVRAKLLRGQVKLAIGCIGLGSTIMYMAHMAGLF